MRPLDPAGPKVKITIRMGPTLLAAIKAFCAADDRTQDNLIACGVAMYAARSGRAKIAENLFPASAARLMMDQPCAEDDVDGASVSRLSEHDPRALAAEKLIGQFQTLSRRLAPKDSATQEDLCGEMVRAVLQCPKGDETLGYYAKHGELRAKDWLRKHRIRARPDLKTRAVEMSQRVDRTKR